MADLTQTSPMSLTDRLDQEALNAMAPSQAELMRELGVKPRPGWTSRARRRSPD